MTTDNIKKDTPKEAAKKGLVIGFRVGLVGIVASILFVLVQTSVELPKCDSDEAISMATQHLDQNRWLKLLNAKVTEIQNPVTTETNNGGAEYRCMATMNTSIGKTMPVAYRIRWADQWQDEYIVSAGIER